jgi:hypothetical protein
MGCARIRTLDRKGYGFMCGPAVQSEPCRDCGVQSEYLCDYPVGNDKTCDAQLCEEHAYEVAPGVHYCKGHYEQWKKFVETEEYQRKYGNPLKDIKLCGKCVDFYYCVEISGHPIGTIKKLKKEQLDECFNIPACKDFIPSGGGKIKAFDDVDTRRLKLLARKVKGE